jgi:carboxymethylenebutenolidase
VRVYPSAGHAFFDDTRGAYVASAADDAWKRTTKFFAAALGLEK